MRYAIAVLSGLCLLFSAGCKTNEANYKAAYEKAKSKGESEAVDKEVYEKIAQEEGPKTLYFGDTEIPAKIMYVSFIPDEDRKPTAIEGYSVAGARFKQLFNARSVANRLKAAGFENAFVVKDKDDYYYAIAATVSTVAEAREMMEKVKGSGVNMASPFPYVIVRPGAR